MIEFGANMRLQTDDLASIGVCTFHMEGDTIFIVKGDLVGISRILLREILNLTGHRITAEGDWFLGEELNDDDEIDYAFKTNFPWKEYAKIPSIDLPIFTNIGVRHESD